MKATLHWVSAADALCAEIRIFDHLFSDAQPGAGDIPGGLNPDSLKVLRDCRLEPALADAVIGEAVQFERQGYFCLDPDSVPGKLVFNRTAALRDSWAKIQAT